MSLKSLLLCSDEKIVRVLRRVLGDLDIAVELCADADSALRKLTRQRFEAIIVDVTDDGASDVLRSARSAPCNKQAVAVAIVEPIIGLKAVFGIGAHFVLYKPVSSERAKSSFRAARALMKSERRRNARVAVQIPVVLRSSGVGRQYEGDDGRPERRRHGGQHCARTASQRDAGRSLLPCRERRRLWSFQLSLPGKGRVIRRGCASSRSRPGSDHGSCGNGSNRILPKWSRTIRRFVASLPI